MQIILTPRLEKKIFDKRIITETGCWIWIGYVNFKGYGRMVIDNKQYYLHRLSAHFYLGLDLTDPKQNACHKDKICQRTDCFNPDHLYVGNKDTNGKDHAASTKQCKYGHEYTAENTYLGLKGEKNCIICHRRRDAEYRYNKRNKLNVRLA